MEVYFTASYSSLDPRIRDHRRLNIVKIRDLLERRLKTKVHMPMFDIDDAWPDEKYILYVLTSGDWDRETRIAVELEKARRLECEINFITLEEFGFVDFEEAMIQEPLIPDIVMDEKTLHERILPTNTKHDKQIKAYLDTAIPRTDPKRVFAQNKLPLHLWPATATMMGCIGMLNGALKYGRSNTRVSPILISDYIDACKRHLEAYFEGEENDPDDGVPHLAAALATLAILVDSLAAEKVIDDRQIKGGYRKLRDELTVHVERLRELHKGKQPKHYMIGES